MKINNKCIGKDKPVYFIADIAANHDGDLERAKQLVRLAKEAGADCAKFQNFRAKTIVSDYGFKQMSKGSMSHQDSWSKSVVEIYEDASVPLDWTPIIKKYCDEIGIEYLTTPYDLKDMDYLNKFVNAFKIGSGDITWPKLLIKAASYGKPILIATGASRIEDVKRAMKILRKYTNDIVLMQCNTNYTADEENMNYINLNVLKTYGTMYPDTVLGLSDHTHGLASVLGAVALGAKVIERHLTDNNDREGPDHKFAMNPVVFAEMVKETRRLEKAMGDGIKDVEENEKDTFIVQRRCLRTTREIMAGEIITEADIIALRPAPIHSYKPYHLNEIIGKKAVKNLCEGEELTPLNIK